MQLHNQVLNNPHQAAGIMNLMSVQALKDLALDIKAQVNAGLLSDNIASDRLNLITGIILNKECKNVCSDIVCN